MVFWGRNSVGASNLAPEQLDDLGFQYGLEAEVDEHDAELLRFEIPANRYDLLSVEGLASSLGVYIGTKSLPVFSLRPPHTSTTMLVKQSVGAR